MTLSFEAFDRMPDRRPGARGHAWTQDELDLLWAFWPRKRHQDVARALRLSENCVRKKYETLVAQGYTPVIDYTVRIQGGLG